MWHTPHVRRRTASPVTTGTGAVPTPASTRHDDNNPPTANRMPLGLDPLPATHMPGRSPHLAAASPRTLPFTLQTPGGVGADPLGAASLARPTPAPTERLTAPFTGSALFPTTTMPPATPAAAKPPPADDHPPLQSMLDVAPAVPVATGIAAAAAAPSALPPLGGGATAAAAAAMPSTLSGYWVTAFGYHSTAMLGALLDELRPPGGGGAAQARQRSVGPCPLR